MWCTRWFLPLLLLPLPTAPPYFLLLFLFSLTMHAKPCFYCIVLLTTLFLSSCYWQPFPLDSPLSAPWAENITTFAEALNATIMPNYSKPLPDVMRAADRCWCDFSSGSFFGPFNVSDWERISVQRLKEDLERQESVEEPVTVDFEITKEAPSTTQSSSMPRTSAPSPSLRPKPVFPGSLDLLSLFRFYHIRPNEHRHMLPDYSVPPTLQSKDTNTLPATSTKLPLLRREYDLRPYGLGILINFGWT